MSEDTLPLIEEKIGEISPDLKGAGKEAELLQQALFVLAIRPVAK